MIRVGNVKINPHGLSKVIVGNSGAGNLVWEHITPTIYNITVTSGQTVNLQDTLTGLTSIDWGDGTISVTNEQHTYDAAGNYNIQFLGVSSIANNAGKPEFTWLNSVILGNTVKGLGTYAFAGCANLNNITLPQNKFKTIGMSVFQDCTNITSISIPNTVTTIQSAAFYGCTGLTTIVIPDSVTTMYGYVFTGCSNLSQVTLSQNLTKIDEFMFTDCTKLTTVNIPPSIASIEQSAFRNCNKLTFNGRLILPNTVLSIGDNAFYNCASITEIATNKVQYINLYAFKNCTSLVWVSLGSSLKEIRSYAFDNVGSSTAKTTYLSFASTPPNLGSNVFTKTNIDSIQVAHASVTTYQTAWKDYTAYITEFA